MELKAMEADPHPTFNTKKKILARNRREIKEVESHTTISMPGWSELQKRSWSDGVTLEEHVLVDALHVDYGDGESGETARAAEEKPKNK